MTCSEAQEIILQKFEEKPGTGWSDELEPHLAACPTCREFAAEQEALDGQLTAALPAPELNPAFREALYRHVRAERRREWRYWLPDVLHFVSTGLALLICAVLLPVPASRTLAIGAPLILGSYAVQSVLSSWFEAWESSTE